MKTISILGSGWLGLPLIKHFVSLGYQVNASVRSEHRMSEILAMGATPYRVDIDTCVIDNPLYLDADILIVNIPSKNVAGFRWLIEKIAGSAIKNILFVSSTSVYQDVRKTLCESDVENLQHVPLRDIEILFQSIDGVDTTVLRLAGLIGPGRHPGRFFSGGRTVPNPDSPVNMIHLDDCVAIVGEIIAQGCWGQMFNACADTHPTKREFYGVHMLAYSGSLPNFGGSDLNIGKIISNDKLKRTLGYTFIHPDLMTQF